jgi:FkbM family methyltransferase
MIINLEKEIWRHTLKLQRALHIGAHYGEEDPRYQALGIEPIYVEANPEVFKVLKRNVPSRECHLTAISDHVGTAEFHVTSFDQSSSLLPLKKHAVIYPKIVEQGVIKVPCTTVDQLLGDRCESIDLINMDIQGAELMALRGAKKTLPHVSCILTEVNRDEMYSGCAIIDQVDKFLAEFGFQRTLSSFKFHPSWGDALYVKRHLIKHRSLFDSFRYQLSRGRIQVAA